MVETRVSPPFAPPPQAPWWTISGVSRQSCYPDPGLDMGPLEPKNCQSAVFLALGFPQKHLVAKSCLTLATPPTVARQAPLSMGFFRQQHWSGFPSTGALPHPGVELMSPAFGRRILYHWATWEAPQKTYLHQKLFHRYKKGPKLFSPTPSLPFYPLPSYPRIPSPPTPPPAFCASLQELSDRLI